MRGRGDGRVKAEHAALGSAAVRCRFEKRGDLRLEQQRIAVGVVHRAGVELARDGFEPHEVIGSAARPTAAVNTKRVVVGAE